MYREISSWQFLSSTFRGRLVIASWRPGSYIKLAGPVFPLRSYRRWNLFLTTVLNTQRLAPLLIFQDIRASGDWSSACGLGPGSNSKAWLVLFWWTRVFLLRKTSVQGTWVAVWLKNVSPWNSRRLTMVSSSRYISYCWCLLASRYNSKDGFRGIRTF